MKKRAAAILNTLLKPAGVTLKPIINEHHWKELVEIAQVLGSFRPFDTGYDLIRAGNNGDGGYLIPNDLDESDLLFSPGSDRLADFENYLAKNYGIKSVIIDTQDKKPLNLEPGVTFDSGWIQAWTDPKGTSLDDWINAHSSTTSNLILQMDIEGSEYSVLQSLPTATLARFKILIIEFHFLEQIKDFHSRELLLRPTIEKLRDLFDVVHTHANNCCGQVEFGAMKFPRVIEVTFHRKDRRLMNPVAKNTPHKLDFPNLVGFPTPEISWAYFEDLNLQNISKF
jgi:hypothetical protein